MLSNKITCEHLQYDYKRDKYYCVCLAVFLGKDWHYSICEAGKCVACANNDCMLLPCSESCHVANDVDTLQFVKVGDGTSPLSRRDD